MTDNVKDIFGNERPLTDRPEMHLFLDKCVAKTQGRCPDMAAFFLIAVGTDGESHTSYKILPDQHCGATHFAGIVSAVVLKELIVDPRPNE